MREVIRGTYTSLIFSMLFALVVLLLTSGNVLITIYAMLTITFIIADTVAVFVLCGWELNILETIIIIMSVGLSVDFSEFSLHPDSSRRFVFLCSRSLRSGVHQSRLEEEPRGGSRSLVLVQSQPRTRKILPEWKFLHAKRSHRYSVDVRAVSSVAPARQFATLSSHQKQSRSRWFGGVHRWFHLVSRRCVDGTE